MQSTHAEREHTRCWRQRGISHLNLPYDAEPVCLVSEGNKNLVCRKQLLARVIKLRPWWDWNIDNVTFYTEIGMILSMIHGNTVTIWHEFNKLAIHYSTKSIGDQTLVLKGTYCLKNGRLMPACTVKEQEVYCEWRTERDYTSSKFVGGTVSMDEMHARVTCMWERETYCHLDITIPVWNFIAPHCKHVFDAARPKILVLPRYCP